MTTRAEKVLFDVKLGPCVYTVKKVHSLHSGDSSALFGICMGLDKEIQVRDGMQPQQELQTMLHELLHGIINEYCIRNAAGLESDEEEVIVDLLALGLAEALASSPKLRRYIEQQVKQSPR